MLERAPEDANWQKPIWSEASLPDDRHLKHVLIYILSQFYRNTKPNQINAHKATNRRWLDTTSGEDERMRERVRESDQAGIH